MTKDEIKELVRQVIVDMSKDYGIATEMTAVANVTGNIGGFDAPLGPKIKRKFKDSDYDDDDDND